MGIKNPVGIISALSDAGLDALKVYRSDGKVPGIILFPFFFCKFNPLYRNYCFLFFLMFFFSFLV
jgi:hypothetical protein